MGSGARGGSTISCVPVAGSQRTAELVLVVTRGPGGPKKITLPVGNTAAWMADKGSANGALHAPTSARGSATAVAETDSRSA